MLFKIADKVVDNCSRAQKNFFITVSLAKLFYQRPQYQLLTSTSIQPFDYSLQVEGAVTPIPHGD